MRNRLTQIARATSLALFVITIGMWVRSWIVADWMQRSESFHGTVTIGSGAGCIFYSKMHHDYYFETRPWTYVRRQPGYVQDEISVRVVQRSIGIPGLRWTSGSVYRSSEPSRESGYISYGCLAVLTGALPMVWLISGSRRFLAGITARREGRCVACGYDLRATPDRCPECGTPAGVASSMRRSEFPPSPT